MPLLHTSLCGYQCCLITRIVYPLATFGMSYHHPFYFDTVALHFRFTVIPLSSEQWITMVVWLWFPVLFFLTIKFLFWLKLDVYRLTLVFSSCICTVSWHISSSSLYSLCHFTLSVPPAILNCLTLPCISLSILVASRIRVKNDLRRLPEFETTLPYVHDSLPHEKEIKVSVGAFLISILSLRPSLKHPVLSIRPSSMQDFYRFHSPLSHFL